jgi:hypothetical protein
MFRQFRDEGYAQAYLITQELESAEGAGQRGRTELELASRRTGAKRLEGVRAGKRERSRRDLLTSAGLASRRRP